jgi:hypothetical protein
MGQICPLVLKGLRCWRVLLKACNVYYWKKCIWIKCLVFWKWVHENFIFFFQTCICWVLSTNTEGHTEIRKKWGSGLQYTEPWRLYLIQPLFTASILCFISLCMERFITMHMPNVLFCLHYSINVYKQSWVFYQVTDCITRIIENLPYWLHIQI